MKRKIRKRPGSKLRKSINHVSIPLEHQFNPTRRVSTEQAQKVLSDSGIDIEKEDAAKVLEFMYQLAKLIIDQNFKK
ncbi:hypothetical protein FFJ24_005550 [Pedobacter sp. KBS0701]|uniref:hypothetical protein n=1 Tax=Pedobacter sp. KBS0701 TaxID=2578106 RepID=UPI00110EA9EF|nr:hypothetical protein [Pedobacter sp. KBS0701]QDW24315.1 hypothetical protein FFJ24_005550 [Pedobacter sp. KBS0701]